MGMGMGIPEPGIHSSFLERGRQELSNEPKIAQKGVTNTHWRKIKKF
jgi:hypothetical protein